MKVTKVTITHVCGVFFLVVLFISLPETAQWHLNGTSTAVVTVAFLFENSYSELDVILKKTVTIMVHMDIRKFYNTNSEYIYS